MFGKRASALLREVAFVSGDNLPQYNVRGRLAFSCCRLDILQQSKLVSGKTQLLSASESSLKGSSDLSHL